MADDTGAATATDDTTTTDADATDDTNLDDVLKDAQNPDAVKNAIDRQKQEAKAARQRASELEAKLKEYEDRDKSAQQKAEEKATGAEQRAAQAEAKALRFEVAAAKGVPLSQAHRLQGSSKEELEQDADAFLKDVRPGTGGQLDGGARSSSVEPDDMDSMIRRAAGY
jgi:cell division septum initiation protein DivIVA